MTDPLAAVLAKLAAVPVGMPGGWMWVREGDALAHGLDAEQARAWILEHGGEVRPDGPSAMAPGPTVNRVFVALARPGSVGYLIPNAVLEAAE